MKAKRFKTTAAPGKSYRVVESTMAVTVYHDRIHTAEGMACLVDLEIDCGTAILTWSIQVPDYCPKIEAILPIGVRSVQ